MRILAIGIVSTLVFGLNVLAAQDIVDAFLSNSGSTLISYRALRTLEASTRGGRMRATLTAVTSWNLESGFQYSILEEMGSTIIRNKVLRAALEAERQISRDGTTKYAAINADNYDFAPAGEAEAGVARIDIHPKRKDTMLMEGHLFVAMDGAELLHVEGTLVKRPSFWTRRVDVVRRYARIYGVRVPIEMRSTADVLIAGTSTFTMSYDYEMINGESIGASPTTVSDDSTRTPADMDSEEATGTVPTDR